MDQNELETEVEKLIVKGPKTLTELRNSLPTEITGLWVTFVLNKLEGAGRIRKAALGKYVHCQGA